MNEAWEATQLSTMKRQYDEAGFEALNVYSTTGDEKARQALLQKWSQDIDGIQSKSNSVNRQFGEYRNKVEPQWAQDFAGMEVKIQNRNIEAEMRANISDAVDKNDAPRAIEQIEMGVSKGIIAPGDGRELIVKAKHDAQLLAAERIAMSQPDELLGMVEGDKIKGYDELTPDDVYSVRHRALMEKDYREAKVKSDNSAAIEAERLVIDQIFIKPQDEFLANVPDALSLINNSKIMPVKDKEEQRKKINDRVDAIKAGKIDPVDEFDLVYYKNLSDRLATNSRTVPESEINGAVGKGTDRGITGGENGQQGNLIKLKRFLENNEADQRLYSEYTKALSTLKATKAFHQNRKRNDVLAAEAQILLNQWASTENRSPLDYQQFFDGIIDTVGLTSGGLWWSGQTEEQRRASVGMREFAISMGADLGEEMPRIVEGDTAAWKKLKSGTKYIDSKGNIAIK